MNDDCHGPAPHQQQRGLITQGGVLGRHSKKRLLVYRYHVQCVSSLSQSNNGICKQTEMHVSAQVVSFMQPWSLSNQVDVPVSINIHLVQIVVH